MFRFDKARTPKNAQEESSASVLDQSIDYANYLIEIQEGKQHILQGIRDKTQQKQKLIKANVHKEQIDFYDLRASGAANETSQRPKE